MLSQAVDEPAVQRIVQSPPTRKAHHPRGHGCKRIKTPAGWKMFYFGKVADDPEGHAAREKWLAERDYHAASLTPPKNPEGLTVKELVNRFLTAKAAFIQTGELSARTFRQYDTRAATARAPN